MPAWVQVIGAITALVALLAALWSKVLRPGAGLITSTEEMLPLLRDLTSVFRDSPGVFQVLNQIASQFRTDSGSSLRDVVNRLEAAAVENRNAGEALKVGVEASRLLSERDRQQLDRLIVLLDRLTIRVDALATFGLNVANELALREEKLDAATAGIAGDLADRETLMDKLASGVALDLAERERAIDRASTGVADDLTERQRQIDKASSGVAEDLAAAQQRASEAVGAAVTPGKAADAAVLPPSTTISGPFIPADASPAEAREIVEAWIRATPGASSEEGGR